MRWGESRRFWCTRWDFSLLKPPETPGRCYLYFEFCQDTKIGGEQSLFFVRFNGITDGEFKAGF